jgi:hypothetical protein
MKKLSEIAIRTISHILFLAAIVIVVGICILKSVAPDALPFKDLSAQAFTGLIAWLFAVALFVERAVEVVVMVFRDYSADLLQATEDSATAANTSATKALSANPTDPGLKTTADKTQSVLDEAHKNNVMYRAKTKEIALSVGFVFGAMVSVAGVRALHGLLADNTTTTGWFTFADIIVTSAMLAGGSEGIHRIANAFTSFMDNLSSRADQDQKNRAKQQ